MLRSVLLILSGNAAAALLLLARNLIVARLISIEDYGIAATFAIIMAVVEMMSQLGLQQQIVQSEKGDDPRFQAGLQGFQVLRGMIAGVLLFFCAGWIANFLNVPHVAWAYQVLAVVPILNALQHFDIHRLNRQMQFWPMVLTGAVPALVSLMSIWPLYLWFGDYKVMLWAIILQITLMMMVSHLVAERPYKLALNPTIMGSSLRFGWPLLINGILMFAVFNGDKMIVGRMLGMETLAIFAVGVTLTLTPTLVVAKSAQNFFLPQLSKLDHTDENGTTRFQHLGLVSLQVNLINGALIVLGVALLGPWLINTLLGAKYAALIPLLLPLAVVQGIRVAKAGSSIVALSVGQTTNAMLANLPRVATLPMIWIMLQEESGLLAVVGVAAVGEVFGYILSLSLLQRKVGIDVRPLIGSLLSFAFFMGAALYLPLSSVLWALTLLMILLFFTMGDLRSYVMQRRI